MADGPRFVQLISRHWWIPVAGAVLAALVATAWGQMTETKTTAVTVTVDLHRTGDSSPRLSPIAESAIIESADVIETAIASVMEAQGPDSGQLTSARVARSLTSHVDVEAETVAIQVKDLANTTEPVAVAIANAYIAERESRQALTDQATATRLAEQAAILTRDLTSATLSLAEAEADERLEVRLEARILALEIALDAGELSATAAGAAQARLDRLEQQLTDRVPTVTTLDRAKALTAIELLTPQLESLRNNLLTLSTPPSPVAVLSSQQDLSSGGSGAGLATISTWAAIGLAIGSVCAAGLAQRATTDPTPRAPVQLPEPPKSPPTPGLQTAPIHTSLAAEPEPPLAEGPPSSTELPPILVHVPPSPNDAVQPVVVNAPDSDAATQYQRLTGLIQSAASGLPTPTVRFVGPGSAVGRTTTSVNVAATLRDQGARVLLITPSWRDIELPGLSIMGPGLGNHDEQPVDGELLEQALERLEDSLDVVIVDTEASSADTSTGRAASSDLTVLVVMAERSVIPEVRETYARLNKAGARTLGIVVNAQDRRADSSSIPGLTTAQTQDPPRTQDPLQPNSDEILSTPSTMSS